MNDRINRLEALLNEGAMIVTSMYAGEGSPTRIFDWLDMVDVELRYGNEYGRT